MTVNGQKVNAVYAGGRLTYTPAADMTDGRTNVSVTVTRADGKTASFNWFFTVGQAQYQLYFGQLHSHTQYSDGAGSLDAALDYVKNLPESANVQFVAFTDHSNYFDTTGAANPEGALYDMSLASASSQETWNSYQCHRGRLQRGQRRLPGGSGGLRDDLVRRPRPHQHLQYPRHRLPQQLHPEQQDRLCRYEAPTTPC